MVKLSKQVLRDAAAYWGRQGGKTAARNLTPEQRRKRASKAGKAGGRGRAKTMFPTTTEAAHV